MPTKNAYSYPIDKSLIKDIELIKKLSAKSIAHVISHNKYGYLDLRHAIDFLCDEGTPVMAALDGTVHFMKTDVTKNYDKKEAPPEDALKEEEQDGNYVVLRHENDEYSIYSHLRHGSIGVKLGQHVKEGEVIGLSGNTGWSIKPHLHFTVFNSIERVDGKRDRISREVRWK
jgi:murein DD-endopeptidase MepM/ murein hydrolase activator NlpD